MKSRTSFINNGLLRNDFKRFAWIGVVYLLGLLLSIPLKIIMAYNMPEEVKIHYSKTFYQHFFNFDSSALQMMLFLIVPVLAGLLLFRYLQDSKTVSMEHALPVRRETIYNTHTLAGIILLFVPLIITALVSWGLVAALGIPVSGVKIMSWLGVGLVFNLLLFVSTVAVGMCTGISVLQGVFTYILLLLPAGFSMLLSHNLSMYVYGWPAQYYGNGRADGFSPLPRLIGISNSPIRPGEIIAYLLISAVLLFLGRLLYQRRQLETAGEAITFDVLRPVFKYGVTFCFMLVGGSYFYDERQGMGWIFFGYLLGALFGYILAEMLLAKSPRVFQKERIKGFGIYALTVLVLIGLLQVDITGYEKRLPQFSEVENVYMDNGFYRLIAEDRGTNPYEEAEFRRGYPVFEERDNLLLIRVLHQTIIANREEDRKIRGYDTRHESICLAYKMKDGSRMYRQYSIPFQKYAALLRPIYESREFKKEHSIILRIDPATVKLVEINGYYGDIKARISDPELIKEAIAALQKDAYEKSFEEMTGDGQSSRACITLWMNSDRIIGLEWEQSDANFENWLNQAGRNQMLSGNYFQ